MISYFFQKMRTLKFKNLKKKSNELHQCNSCDSFKFSNHVSFQVILFEYKFWYLRSKKMKSRDKFVCKKKLQQKITDFDEHNVIKRILTSGSFISETPILQPSSTAARSWVDVSDVKRDFNIVSLKTHRFFIFSYFRLKRKQNLKDFSSFNTMELICVFSGSYCHNKSVYSKNSISNENFNTDGSRKWNYAICLWKQLLIHWF
jgi:hypothetical protein